LIKDLCYKEAERKKRLKQRRKIRLKIKLADGAKMPQRISDNIFAVFSNVDITLDSGQRAIIKTGLFSEFEQGIEMKVVRIKNDCIMLNEPGTVDADYRGEIGVILKNNLSKAIDIKQGGMIAWIVMAPYINPIKFDTRSHGSKLAAGYDIFSAKDIAIAPEKKGFIETSGEFVFAERGNIASVRGRSGNAINLGLYVPEEIYEFDEKFSLTGVWVTNHGNETITLPAGSKVAQAVFSKAIGPLLDVEIEEIFELSKTERDTGGFGHSDNKITANT
jgi:dUTP pyrophosphatase